MGQHFPDDMARKRQDRRTGNRVWRTEILDELALLRRPAAPDDEVRRITDEAELGRNGL